MNKRQFVQNRQADWKRFESLVDRVSGTPFFNLESTEITEFSRLFRKLSGDLAIIRSRGWGQELAGYLNSLVSRGHNKFYSAPAARPAALLRFITVQFPRVFRRNIGYFFVSAALFFLPGAVSWAVIQLEPSMASRVIPNEYLLQFDAMYGDGEAEESPSDAARDFGDEGENAGDSGWSGGFGEERALMYGFYVRNNVGIALACFARGVLLGAGTVYTLLFNGIFIGATAGYVVGQGNSERFLSFIISHGSFELTAIAVAGGAGLMLGDAILHPGQHSRLESLRTRGLESVQVACGAAVMLIVAAVIEAFWSPSGAPAMLKFIVGVLLWVLVLLYLAFAGRKK